MHGGLRQCNFTETVVFGDGRLYIIGATPDPTTIANRVFDWGQFCGFLDTINLDRRLPTTRRQRAPVSVRSPVPPDMPVSALPTAA
jgi:hypothetical protein